MKGVEYLGMMMQMERMLALDLSFVTLSVLANLNANSFSKIDDENETQRNKIKQNNK